MATTGLQGTGAEASTPAQPTAIRNKSGLVRTASGFDAFVFALAGISVGIMFSWGQYFGLGFYPRANIPLALVIATVAGLILAWAYQYWGLIFPRSGGDYVFLSRGLHPGVALGTNIVLVYMLMVSPALAMSIMVPLLQSLAATLASVTGWGFLNDVATWTGGKIGFAVWGTALMVGAGWVALYGLRPSLRFMKLLFLIGIVGSGIAMIALLFSKTSTFEHHLQAATGHSAAAIEAKAKQQGFAYGGFSLSETLKLTVWYTPSLFFAYLVLYIGGEIKNVQRNVRFSAAGAVLFSGVFTLIFSGVFTHVVPSKLQGALAYNATAAPGYTTTYAAYPHELTKILWGTHGLGLILTLIMFVSMFAWLYLWTPLVLGFAQRAVLAWALDGLTPGWVGKVDEKRHTPLPALAIVFIMGESLMLAFAFSTSFRTIVLLAPMYAMLAISMAVGAVFPYVRKDLFNQSVVAKARVFGVPLMTIFCSIAFVVLIWQIILLWRDKVAAGANHTAIFITVGVAVAGIIYFFAMREYRKRQGDDISYVFRQIPVE
jgi:APA family basic amino acid/polyamine antiporter